MRATSLLRRHPGGGRVTFDVKEGEIFAIVGPNGAGKSTIFNLISRIYEPTGGR